MNELQLWETLLIDPTPIPLFFLAKNPHFGWGNGVPSPPESHLL